MSKKYRAPKRKIDKFVVFDNGSQSGQTEASTVLYTATRESTLVRIVGSITIYEYQTQANKCNMMIVLRPDGTDVVDTLTFTSPQSIDGRAANLILWAGGSTSDDHAVQLPLKFDIDTKGQRKLEIDDTLAFRIDGSNASGGWSWSMALTLFFKLP